jgi:hypothetical protein
LSSVAAAPPVYRWKTFRSKLNAIPAGDKKLFAFPPESAFTFRPEYCSDSQRNGVRLQTGIAFIFDRIPQLKARNISRRRADLSPRLLKVAEKASL